MNRIQKSLKGNNKTYKKKIQNYYDYENKVGKLKQKIIKALRKKGKYLTSNFSEIKARTINKESQFTNTYKIHLHTKITKVGSEDSPKLEGKLHALNGATLERLWSNRLVFEWEICG